MNENQSNGAGPHEKSLLDALQYPLDYQTISRKRLAIRRRLLEQSTKRRPIRIAILGGVTTSEFKTLTELFLLKQGFEPVFHESEYGRFYEDGALENKSLEAFKPEIIIVFSHWRNLSRLPQSLEPDESVAELFQQELARFQTIWQNLITRHNAVVIQNNFDLPATRILGNRDSVESYGISHFLLRLNTAFAEESRKNSKLLINDIHYLAMKVGLDRWQDPSTWFSYKHAFSLEGHTSIAFNVSTILQGLYGLSKKAVILDLDNTLWGGIIGDDGVEKIQMGRETAVAEAYLDFQQYLKDLHHRGILLCVCSKNDEVNARSGFSHPDAFLKLENFSAFKANWEPKSKNIETIATELNLGRDSFVFVDDNPAERHIVRSQLPDIAVPDIGADIVNYKLHLDRNAYFETTRLVDDDLQRAKFYEENNQRLSMAAKFENYEDYLLSLDMTAEIGPFNSTYMNRITQLINKTNQFNLTTKRYSDADTASAAADPHTITLYGRLKDRFGDNGLISLVIAKQDSKNPKEANIDLWLMSCRVLKREMEIAMFDALIEACQERGIQTLYGIYLRTKKNDMVSQFYSGLGFEPINQSHDSSRWKFEIQRAKWPQCKVIRRTNGTDAGESTANFS